jgi:alkanesulfonate monooxygenase SsuD/methylene tetrahydromethanopterin reductase-like flavin-dependent oxidoreductase (luciferase family)
MRVGTLMIPTDPWPVARARAVELESLGYDHLWTYDHLTWQRYRGQPWHAAVPWLTGVAAATSRIRLGTMVTSPNFRHPVTLAKDVMTLDHISSGRLVLGIGAGGTGFDSTTLGNEPWSTAERTARFEEFVLLLDRLLREPETTYRGEFYSANEAEMLPGCVQRPRVPLAISALGPKSIALAARYADAWITLGDPKTKEAPADEQLAAIRSQVARFEDGCAALGRDPATVDRIFLTGGLIEQPLSSTDEFLDFAGRYAEMGFTDLVFHDPRPGDLRWDQPVEMVERIAAEVLPKLR